MSKKFTDGLVNLVNKLANNRSGSTVNKFKPSRLEREQLRAIYKTGIGNKIVRLKAGMAFDDTLVFESKTDGDYWHDVAERKAIDAVQGMLSYGRGIVVIHHKGDDLAKPLGKVDQQSVILSEFTGDLVTVGNVSRDLQGGHYLKPLTYTVEGHQVHHSRVVDFRYVKPPEREAALYLYGGISEFELIVEQLVNDGIIERASSAIVDKSSTFVYKVAGFKDALRAGNDDELIDYFTQLENLRSIHGGLVIDNEDDATSVSQALTNLSEINEMSLRRIALVTGIPVSYLIGEAVRGLNSTGESERNALLDTIQQLQKLFLTQPVWELCDKLGLGARRWADDQGITDSDRANYEATILDNALKLWQMGEDANKYLSDKGLADEFDADDFWKPSETVASEPVKDPTTPKPDPFQDALTDALNRVTATTTKD